MLDTDYMVDRIVISSTESIMGRFMIAVLAGIAVIGLAAALDSPGGE